MSTVSLVFALIAGLGNKSGASPVNKFEACWEKQVDPVWWIAMNGHRETVKCSRGADVPPFHCYVEFNGWPAGLINPYDGVLAAGAVGNEDNFITALKAAGAECREAEGVTP